MNTICKWVHVDDGALVVGSTKAEELRSAWGTDGSEIAYTFEVFDHNADALGTIGD